MSEAASGDADIAKMRFCRECNNLLYPKENRELKTLEYVCRLCDYKDTSFTGSCVHEHHIVKDTATRLENVLSDLNKDPTLQRSHTVDCPNCSHNEAVFFQADVTLKSTKLTLVFICCSCGWKWMDR
jgi:DNA-directed RNA polymerase II subunit RPB9